ncbi:hypothetical protein KR038_000209 [Drosophila bunnanda]|nr:hypothetical protein KR038_000209 [Drosophila bunnanda]
MAFTYKELIEVAIGSPESGHVNFYALQVLLTCFAQRLEVFDQVVLQDDYMMTNDRFQKSLLNLNKSRMPRMFAGADVEEDAPTEAPAEDAPAVTETEEAPPVVEAEEVPPVDNAEEVPPVDNAEEVPPVDNAEEAPPLPQGEDVTAEEIATTEPTEAVPEPEPEPAAAEEPPASQPEANPSQGSIPVADEKCVSAVPSQASHRSEKTSFVSLTGNFMRLESRLSRIELYQEKGDIELKHFVTNLTGQVKIIVKQLDNVTHMMLDRRQDPHRIKVLRQFAKEIKVLMKAADEEISIRSSTNEDEHGEEEMGLEELQEEASGSTLMEKVEEEHVEEFGLKSLCYSPSQILNELLDNKAQFCALTNKVNDLTAAFYKQDSQRLLGMITDLQSTLREFKLYMGSSMESNGMMMTRLQALESESALLKKSSAHLDIVKLDKAEMELLLAEKPNFQQLATKVSLEQLEDFKARLENTFCETRNLIGINEKNILQIIDNLRMTMGIDALELSFKDFREMIERKVHMIADTLQKYMELTNDDCAAAAGRVKVMTELACLSCDTECVMRTVERSKMPTLPTAKGSTGLGPLITYELGQIRKSGATSTWAKSISGAPMVKCTQRHAGGTHTIHTAEDHLQKVVLSKKNTVFT